MADYLAPMASGLPDIVVEHVETPETSTMLGAKGIGEAGLIGAMGAVWVAVNDALKPLGARILHQPFTPERVLDAIARARKTTVEARTGSSSLPGKAAPCLELGLASGCTRGAQQLRRDIRDKGVDAMQRAPTRVNIREAMLAAAYGHARLQCQRTGSGDFEGRRTVAVDGALSPEGKKQQRGYDIWADTVNAKGGIKVGGKTYKVELVYVDYASNTPRAVQTAER